MTDSWLIRVYHDQHLQFFKECIGPLELGRQHDPNSENSFQVSNLPDGGCRIAIARNDEVTVSRRLARVEHLSENRVRVRNLSTQVSLGVEGSPQLKPGGVCERALPIVLMLGSKVVRIQEAAHDEARRAIQSLEQPAELSHPALEEESRVTTLELVSAKVPDVEGVIGWLRAMIRVLQSAASDADFFEKAAQAVVEVVRLDLGRVLTRDGESWKTVTFFPESDHEYEQNNPPSRLVLTRVSEEKRTCWFDPLQLPEDGSSLIGVSSLVAAPVLDRQGQVIAILYGERRLQSMLKAAPPVSRLDAMLVEVLAVGLAAGLARVEQEHAALSLRTQLEQFFTPELARQLATRPELLAGRDLEITVLFCDIRGFSRISRNHGPTITLEWINDVLSTLSGCVWKQQGVLVDYIGDELLAMWGAPEMQPDHAARACRSALEMIGCLPELDARWQGRLGEPMKVGVGINTGIARVGNTGSHRKFKYGPLGDTVNVASRVQGASKYFKSSLLITRATHDRLGPEFQLRRLGNARVVNIGDPIELFELCSANGPEACERRSAYEEALVAFEAQEFRKAARILGRLVNTHPDDGPSIALLARAIAYVVEEPETFDPAFRLTGK
ncbi:MAG: adenylate/guanylate cyclase domain-containing protein [Isosphaerales bacterium]